jgi:2-oxoglutarate dehydrogenase E1 component
MHIEDREICNWMRERFEVLQYETETPERKQHMYERLNWAHAWGEFMASKFNTTKRFGLEGCDSFVPGVKYLLDTAVEHGAREFVIGMAHRGRLNTLANVVRKPMEVIMAELQGVVPTFDGDEKQGAGDVKYHLGTTLERKYGKDQVDIRLTLMANPSHLEAVNPCVGGRARAEQHFIGGDDDAKRKVMPIIVHGDAAMSGQGVVFECLQMQSLGNYNVGGTVHVVINNQVGFTTTPDRQRSGNYCTDVAKAINAPVFHVNAQSMEDV